MSNYVLNLQLVCLLLHVAFFHLVLKQFMVYKLLSYLVSHLLHFSPNVVTLYERKCSMVDVLSKFLSFRLSSCMSDCLLVCLYFCLFPYIPIASFLWTILVLVYSKYADLSCFTSESYSN